MTPNLFTKTDIEKITSYFGKHPDALTEEEFEKLLKELRLRYHPDKFEKYDDPTIRELTEEKFKEIEYLSGKMKQFFAGTLKPVDIDEPNRKEELTFCSDGIKIEIISDEKDFKYILFGTHYRWLERGDAFKIKGTGASIVMDDNHVGRTIGFTESIKIYLKFGENDSVDLIVLWLYLGIKGRARYVLIGKKKVNIDYDEMLNALKVQTVLKLNP